MTRLHPRHKLLGGALLLALVVWGADSFLGGPEQAQATSAKVTAPPPEEVAVWQDVSALLNRLTRRHHTPISNTLTRVERDLFLPTPRIEATFVSREQLAEEAAAKAVESDPTATFAGRHQLVGVMLGKQPLAVIDGHLLPIGAELDGHRLLEIHRDRVVFQPPDAAQTIVLELRTGRENP